jgi:hypothetical protein
LQVDFGIPPMHETETAMKPQQDSHRPPGDDQPQAGQAGQRPRDLDQDDTRTAGEGSGRNPSHPARERDGRETRQPKADRGTRGQDAGNRRPGETVQEQDDFGGIGKPDPPSQDEPAQGSSRRR